MFLQSSISLLDSISPYFSVKSTKYGGRGCFANYDLTEGTIIHQCLLPLSSSIRRSFKKEVCEYCFSYFYGKTLKYKLMSLYFCSQSCLNSFQEMDIDNIYLQSLFNVENLFVKGLKRQQSNQREDEDKEEEMIRQLENEFKQSENIELFIDEKWKQMEIECDLLLSKLKTKERINLIPSINENEYLDIKYIIGILFQMYKQDFCLANNNILSFELDLFEHLQLNDVAKVCAYPFLLYSYLKIYKFLKLSTISQLECYVNTSMIRSIIAKNLTNAFSIRSLDEPDGNKEFFGYALYPSASFFNHSCQPNVIHIRIGSKKVFQLSRNVEKDEELVISYTPFENIELEKRKQEIKEWFFDCICQRCINKE